MVTVISVMVPLVAVVLNTIHESAGTMLSLNDVRFCPVVVFVISVAASSIAVPAALLSVCCVGLIVTDGEVPDTTACTSDIVTATKANPIQMFSASVGLSTVIEYKLPPSSPVLSAAMSATRLCTGL